MQSATPPFQALQHSPLMKRNCFGMVMLQRGLKTAGKLSSSGSARAAGREGKYFPYNHIPLATVLKSDCVTLKNEQGTVTSRDLVGVPAS